MKDPSVASAAQGAPAVPLTVLRASHLGMCFGVRDAIALASNPARPLTILGDLVHNETVLSQLHQQGVHTARQVADISTQDVMITAHGASLRQRRELERRGHRVLEATCPLVHHAHRVLHALVAQGYHPVIIGQRDHVEVRGLTGDLDTYEVILMEEDLAKLRPRSRFGVVAQTTQPVERAQRLVALLRERFPAAEVRWVDTVCQPTKQRQEAAVQLARVCTVVVVVGGAHSNNTRELVATCRRYCSRVHHVRQANDVDPDWFRAGDVVGLTAGTSTPDAVIAGVEARLRGWQLYEKRTDNRATGNLRVAGLD